MNNIEKAQQWIVDNSVEITTKITPLCVSATKARGIVATARRIKIHNKWYWSKNVVGYTKNGKIYYNTRNTKSVGKCVDFIIHESCHMNGMTHPVIKWWKHNRAEVYKSLVYRIGRAAGELYNLYGRLS